MIPAPSLRAEHELIQAVRRRPGPVLLVGSWDTPTMVAVANCSHDVSMVALTEADAARVRSLAAAENLPIRVYLPSAALDPTVDRDPHTGRVLWTTSLSGPVPALARVAVAGFADNGLAAALRADLPADTIVVVAGDLPDIQVEPGALGAKPDPLLDSLDTIADAAFHPRASAAFRSLGIDFEDLLAGDLGALTALPVNAFAAIVQALAPTPVLRPRPGWRFNRGWADDDPLVRLRRRLWEWLAETWPAVVLELRWFGGTKLRTRIGTDLSSQLFVTGQYEPNELFAFAAGLSPGGVAIDAGANEGVYTLLGAVRVGSSGRVVAFEPSDRERAILADNISTNDLENVEVEPVALLDRPAEVNLRIAELRHAGQNTLGSFAYAGVGLSDMTSVHAERLDDVTERLRLARVDVLKLDVEGAEHCVLRGAARVLRDMRPLMILELSNETLRFMGSSRLEVIAELRSYNYDVRDFHPDTGLVGAPSSDDDSMSLNVIAGPDGRFPPALLR